MTRWIAALGCVFALTLAMPFGNVAEADGGRKIYRSKKCVAPARMLREAPVTWRCAARQKCCYDWLFRRGTCVAASARCF
ncbi:MAG: hypothetical protein AB7O44_25190 [Hyphomicrobiaceae bacterium]|jgi:hypothetical protein